MRLPTFYEQNLIPNWGISCQNGTTLFVNMIIYSSLNTGITCTVILRWAVKKKGYALWLWQEA